jgi:hypothetical protein
MRVAFLRGQVWQPGEFERQSCRQADSRRHAEAEQEVQEIDGARKALGAEGQENEAAESGSSEVGCREAGDIANGSISPPAAIQIEEMEGEDFGRHKDAEGRQQVVPEFQGQGEVESQNERAAAGGGEYEVSSGRSLNVK